LVGKRVDGAIDAFEVAFLDGDEDDADEGAPLSADAPRQHEDRLAGYATVERQRYAQAVVVVGDEIPEVFAVGDTDVGRRPGRRGHHDLPAIVGDRDAHRLWQPAQSLQQQVAVSAAVVQTCQA
jgi:hypothetical protein